MVDALMLLGPTGSGKSALALELAQQHPLEIVSVDSAQVYRGLDIGTAKPSAAERAAVVHHLLDLRDPTQPYSAADFVRDAAAAIADIRRRGRLPLLVGGTMLYAKALREGLSNLPSADASVRVALTRRGAGAGLARPARAAGRAGSGHRRAPQAQRCTAHPACARNLHRDRNADVDSAGARRVADADDGDHRADAARPCRPCIVGSRNASTACSRPASLPRSNDSARAVI